MENVKDLTSQRIQDLDDADFHFQIRRDRAINYLESLVIISPHQFGMISA